MTDPEFDRLISAAEEASFSGWDFSYLEGRMHETVPSWSYANQVRARLPHIRSLLDMGTGGGELLASLAPLPPGTVATEGYPPNVPIARARLEPLGVKVVPVEGAPDNIDIAGNEGIESLPFPDASFSVVINRHESYYPADIYRILERGGSFITQQVGGEHNQMLNELLGATQAYRSLPEPEWRSDRTWNLSFAVEQLLGAGFRIVEALEEFPTSTFDDIGAIAYYLKAVPWQAPGFTVDAYRDMLAALHVRMKAEGPLRVRGHYFFVEAVKEE